MTSQEVQSYSLEEALRYASPNHTLPPEVHKHTFRNIMIGLIIGAGGTSGGYVSAHWDRYNPFSNNSTALDNPPGQASVQTAPTTLPSSHPSTAPSPTEVPSVTPTPTLSPSLAPKLDKKAVTNRAGAALPGLGSGEITMFAVGDSIFAGSLANGEKELLAQDKVVLHPDARGGKGISGSVPSMESLTQYWLKDNITGPWVQDIKIVRIGSGANETETDTPSPYCDSLPGLYGAKQYSLQARKYCTALGKLSQMVHTYAPKAVELVATVPSQTHPLDYSERNSVDFKTANKYGFKVEDEYSALTPGGHPMDIQADITAHGYSVNLEHTPGDVIDDHLHPKVSGQNIIIKLDRDTIQQLRMKRQQVE